MTAEMTNPMGDSLGPTLLVVAWLFAAISAVVVITRYYIRSKIIKAVKIDDWLILITFLLALGNSASLTVAIHWGLGQHMQFLRPDQIMNTSRTLYVCEVFAVMSPGIGRISFAFLLLAIVPPNPWRRRSLWTIIWIQLAVDCIAIIISFCQCRPLQGSWDHSVKAKCWPSTVPQFTGFVQGSVSSLVDFVLAIFPASLFWNLKMERKQKISLSCLMGLGIFAMIASIIKTVKLRALTEEADYTYEMAILAIWWTLEAYLVLIAASIPTLRPIKKPAQELFSQVLGFQYQRKEYMGRFQGDSLTGDSLPSKHSQKG